MPYRVAEGLQSELLESRKSGQIDDTLLMLEHDHVYTHGRRGVDSHVLMPPIERLGAGVEVIETDRGGETTYHGPGQLVVYPIVSIRQLGIGPVAYVRLLEEVAMQVLSDFGVVGHRVVGKTGVWIDGEPGAHVDAGVAPLGRKIAAIGVRVSAGVAKHGIALNVAPDLAMFDGIVPCGMYGLAVTSIEQELGSAPRVEDVAREWSRRFADVLGYELIPIAPAEVGCARNESAVGIV